MSLHAFIRANRAAIDAVIAQRGCKSKQNDEGRESWILNDEGLYLWAKSEGVPI